MQFLNSLFPWSLIDDGYDLLYSQVIANSVSHFDFRGILTSLMEPGVGRIRPFYWFFNYLQLKIFTYNSFLYHALRIILLIIICVLIYKIALKIYQNKRVALFAPLIFTLFGPTSENWYRLGPVEPLFVLLLAITFYALIVSKNHALASICIILSFLSKESTIALFPIVLIYYLLLKSRGLKIISIISLFGTISLGILLKFYSISGGYSSFYGGGIIPLIESSINSLMGYLQIFTIFLWPIGIIFIIGIIHNRHELRKNKDMYYSLIILVAGFGLFLLFQLPWKFVLGRYLLPEIFFVSLIFPAGLSFFLKNKIKRIVLSLALILFIFVNGILSYNTISQLWIRDYSNSKMIKFLGKEASPNSKILLNIDEGGVEWMTEIGMHLSLFYNRSDIKSDFLSLDPINYSKGDTLLFWSEGQKYDKNLLLTSLQKEIEKTAVISDYQAGYYHNIPGTIKRILEGKITGKLGDAVFYLKEYRWEIYKVL